MAAEKQPIIVIKKINVQAAGAHGGSWKVALADFMTSMMAFFLVMWLVGQSEEVKKNVSDYFSTPSVIEYEFSNYGAELTLEKMFLDLVNEPLKFLQDFMQPRDYTPNFMQMGSANIAKAALLDQLGDYATDMQVSGDTIQMDIPEKYLFKTGTAQPNGKFADVIGRLVQVTTGLENSDVYVDSKVYLNTLPKETMGFGRKIANQRLDLVASQIDAHLEHNTVSVHGRPDVLKPARRQDGRPMEGSIRIRIKQKDVLPNGKKPRKLERIFHKGDDSLNVYDNFVHKVSK